MKSKIQLSLWQELVNRVTLPMLSTYDRCSTAKHTESKGIEYEAANTSRSSRHLFHGLLRLRQ